MPPTSTDHLHRTLGLIPIVVRLHRPNFGIPPTPKQMPASSNSTHQLYSRLLCFHFVIIARSSVLLSAVLSAVQFGLVSASELLRAKLKWGIFPFSITPFHFLRLVRSLPTRPPKKRFAIHEPSTAKHGCAGLKNKKAKLGVKLGQKVRRAANLLWCQRALAPKDRDLSPSRAQNLISHSLLRTTTSKGSHILVNQISHHRQTTRKHHA